ncbi:PQQ-dependent sugar dehydrogenase [Rubritalea sp.]|uniref:PQQ-dependent sugar dehydrogenase n=1 Tax=Rubritalea sp. TaxID=2109375 RepID=UPI003EF608D2
MKPNFILSISALCLFSMKANAASIDWTTSDISSVSDVVTTGTLVSAQNYAGTGAPSVVTVSGIDFVENNGLTNNNSGDFFGLDTGDTDYDTFLGDIDFTPTSETSVTIPMSVVSGKRYLVQIWYAEDNGFALSPQRQMVLTGTGDNTLNGDDYALGTFTADSTTQNVIVTSSREGVRLTGYQLREISDLPGFVTVADAASDYSSSTSEPDGWDYLYSSAATGGNEVALTADNNVGNAGNAGFEGSSLNNTPAILGAIDGGSEFEIFNDGFGFNAGIVGTDLLFHPGNDTATSFVIARYTISAADLLNGTSATVEGSFRRGSTSANGINASVYHNTSALFSVNSSTTGSDDSLSEADGSFSISDLAVAEGDTISFVVDRNSGYSGDETALQASIAIQTSSVVTQDDDFDVMIGSTTGLDILANDEGLEDADLSTLRITSAPSSGVATVLGDDTIEYEHTGSFGTDSFSYAIDSIDPTITHTAVVNISASNGIKTANSTLTFPESAPVGGYQFDNAFSGLTFSQPTCLEKIPGNSQVLAVTERAGNVQLISDVTSSSPTKSLFLDIPNTRTQTFCGLRGLAFHPDFETNRYFYVGYDSTADFGSSGNSTRVSRFTANADDLGTVDTSTEIVLFQMAATANIHRINRMLFGPDGYLYIAVGDDGNSSGPGNSQHIDADFYSSVLRIDVDKNSGNYEPVNTTGVTLDGSGNAYYSVPADNPFIDQNFTDGRGVTTLNGETIPTNDAFQVRTEMFAIGFRNPWKIGFVPGTSDLWVADAGHIEYEKFSIMPSGGNGGWAHFEGTDPGPLQLGTTSYTSPLSDPPAAVTYIQPVLQYKRIGNSAASGVKSIVGGTYYEGSNIAELTGAYLFCDYTKGDIWYLTRPDDGAYQSMGRVSSGSDFELDKTGMTTGLEISSASDFTADTYGVDSVIKIGTELGITAMEMSPAEDGTVFMADYGDGIIRKIVYSENDGSLPTNLSDTGAFSDLTTLTPSEGINPYDINLRFWSDHADKKRFFSLANLDDTITYSEDGFWAAPTGGVWIKHFEMDLNRDSPGADVKRLETRFIVKTEGDFYGVAYKWNDEETEATLVDTDGENIDLTITENGTTHTQTWRIPSRGECRACHTNDNGVVLGFDTRQLNLLGNLGTASGNFLELLAAGYLSSTDPLPTDASTLPKHYTPGDVSANLEKRVRSYLAVNCTYCHYEGSDVVPNSWSGESALTIEETNLLHGESLGGFGLVDESHRIVIPGDTAASILLSRVAESNGYSRMPPLASNVIDEEGVALITDWINNYANAKPTLDSEAGPHTVLENLTANTSVGSGPQATDPDEADAERGTLTYSIEAGNSDGYFAIDPDTGQITINQYGPDYEVADSYDLTVKISDGFTANPGEITSDVTVNVTDIPNDDSQGDGIADEWAKSWFGASSINPLADFDLDGFNEILEYWADSDPTDPSSRGLVITPTAKDSTAGSEGYHFEWTILSSLVIGTDYKVQGSTDLNFQDLELVTDFEVLSTEPVSNPGGEELSLIKVKVPSTEDKYFLRIRSL